MKDWKEISKYILTKRKLGSNVNNRDEESTTKKTASHKLICIL